MASFLKVSDLWEYWSARALFFFSFFFLKRGLGVYKVAFGSTTVVGSRLKRGTEKVVISSRTTTSFEPRQRRRHNHLGDLDVEEIALQELDVRVGVHQM